MLHNSYCIGLQENILFFYFRLPLKFTPRFHRGGGTLRKLFHFLNFLFSLKPSVIKNDIMETVDRIPWEKKYCSNITIFLLLPSIKCNICEIVFPREEKLIRYFIMHLYKSHKITELTEHPEREFLLQKFIIHEENTKAQCRTCKRIIVYNMYGMYLLKNHLETYHGKNSSIYEKAVHTEKGRDILNKYYITGNEATCPKCELKIDCTDLKHTEERLIELLRHYFSHNRYKQKKKICFYLPKRVILFCFNNFIII